MSERYGRCNFCQGTGERTKVVPHTATSERIQLTEAETQAVGVQPLRAAFQTIKVVVYACQMCDGTPGFSGDAMR